MPTSTVPRQIHGSPAIQRVAVYVRARCWRLLFYIMILAFTFALERSGKTAEEEGGGSLSQAARVMYQRVTTFGYRKPKARFTRLVLLSNSPDSQDDPPDVAQNGCTRRLYLSRLIRAVGSQSPSVIVLDFYLTALCPAEDGALLDAISSVAKTVPVVLGQSSETIATLRQKGQGTIGKNIQEEDLVPELPSIAGRPEATWALVTLLEDTRRIPLRWSIAAPGSNTKDLTERRTQDGLALAAAAAHDPTVLADPSLSAYIANGEAPFTSFIPENGFQRQSGLDLLCKGQDKKSWRTCSYSTQVDSFLRGHVVIFGQGRNESGLDMHNSVIGLVSGPVLQANYIESILDGRYFSQTWLGLQIALSFLCFVLIEAVFEYVPRFWLKIICALSVVAIFYLITYVAIVQWGYYVDLWIPSALALILKVVGNLQTWAKERLDAQKG